MMILGVLFLIVLIILARRLAVYIILGYIPARYSLKRICGQLRIYHNGLSERECIDEGDHTETFYSIPPKWAAWLLYSADMHLNVWQERAQKWKKWNM